MDRTSYAYGAADDEKNLWKRNEEEEEGKEENRSTAFSSCVVGLSKKKRRRRRPPHQPILYRSKWKSINIGCSGSRVSFAVVHSLGLLSERLVVRSIFEEKIVEKNYSGNYWIKSKWSLLDKKVNHRNEKRIQWISIEDYFLLHRNRKREKEKKIGSKSFSHEKKIEYKEFGVFLSFSGIKIKFKSENSEDSEEDEEDLLEFGEKSFVNSKYFFLPFSWFKKPKKESLRLRLTSIFIFSIHFPKRKTKKKVHGNNPLKLTTTKEKSSKLWFEIPIIANSCTKYLLCIRN